MNRQGDPEQLEIMGMDWAAVKKWLGWGGAARSAHFVLPTVAVELQPEFVAGARLDGSAHRVRRLSVRELEPGTLEPLASKANLVNAELVRRAVSAVAEAVGNGGGRLGLLIPDSSVRVANLRFETLPERRREAEALVRWRMRELMPFEPEQARLCYEVLAREKGAVELLALAAWNVVLAEYEATLESVDGGAALILPATFALLPLLSAEGPGGDLLLHVCGDSVTTVVVAHGRLLFWRNRTLAPGTPDEQRAEVAREAGRVLATCRDHMLLDIVNIWLCARPLAGAELPGAIARELGREVQTLNPGHVHPEVLSSGEQDLFKRYGMTFAGLLANARYKQ